MGNIFTRYFSTTLDKIDGAAVDGLSGVTDSLAFKVTEIEKHFHNNEQIFGNTSNDMAACIPIKFTVIGGDDAFGTELMLTDGTVIESGSATKKFDFNTIYLVSASAANKISCVEIYYSPIATAVACTFDFTAGTVEDMVISNAHGLENGDKIVLKAGGGALPAELVDYRTYYVVGKDTNYFQVSLTTGGSAVEFTDDGGACFWYPVNAATPAQGAVVQTLGTQFFHVASSVNSDSLPHYIMMPRITCNQRLFIRAKSETGSTISIGFLIGLHTYTA